MELYPSTDNPAVSGQRKAWQVYSPEAEITSIVYASTAGKARWTTLVSARDAGFKIDLRKLHTRRRKDLDNATIDGQIPELRYCYSREFLRITQC